MQRFLNAIIPFILIGIAVVAFSFGILLLSYLFLIGACVGLIIYVISLIKDKLRPKKPPLKAKAKRGRIIDSNDWKEL